MNTKYKPEDDGVYAYFNDVKNLPSGFPQWGTCIIYSANAPIDSSNPNKGYGGQILIGNYMNDANGRMIAFRVKSPSSLGFENKWFIIPVQRL